MGSFGVRLKEERERLGMSQTLFAELAGTTRKSQFNYESDLRRPDADYLTAIADAGVDVLYILTGQRSHSVSTPEPALTRRQSALLDNYDHLTEADKGALEHMAFALAERKKIAKKGKVA